MRATKHKHRWILIKANRLRKGQLHGLSRGQSIHLLFDIKFLKRRLEQALRGFIGRRNDGELRDEVKQHLNAALSEAIRARGADASHPAGI